MMAERTERDLDHKRNLLIYVQNSSTPKNFDVLHYEINVKCKNRDHIVVPDLRTAFITFNMCLEFYKKRLTPENLIFV